MKKTGFLLINLGTPDTPNFSGVWRYLHEFLADKRVVTLPAPLRLLLLYGIILPFRVAKTTRAYQEIWTPQGSPLRWHSEALCHKLQQYVGEAYHVMLAMRYGNPSIEQALANLQHCDHLFVLPLYPQYSSAATGSSLEVVLRQVAQQTFIPHVTMIREFYQHPVFIDVLAQWIKPYIAGHEKVVFSYHGLPENQVQQSGCQSLCLQNCAPDYPPNCYRAQCYQTSSLLAQALQLPAEQITTVFQSRLGRTPWIQPYMEDQLRQLATQGIKRIVVACPSFVTDCLETLEEIGIRTRALWQTLGGEQLTLVPCLNAEDEWCKAIMAFFAITPTNE
jgi:protoporphyrin/coproporphyrin ferrochelatase